MEKVLRGISSQMFVFSDPTNPVTNDICFACFFFLLSSVPSEQV